MNASILRAAKSLNYRDDTPAGPCVIQIDGVEWSSPLPTNSGEAQSYNVDADKICEMVRAK